MSRTWVTSWGFRAAAVAVLTTALMSGCLSESSCSSARRLPEGLRALAIGTSLWGGAASASCAAGLEYQDRFYVAWSGELPVAKGEPLGEAVFPPCDDGNGCSEGPDATGRPTQVWAMRGADPDQILVARDEGSDRLVVYGRLHADPMDYFRFSDGAWHIRKASSASG